MTPTERVRRLVEAKTVSPAEGERMLKAMGGVEGRSGLNLLLDPFQRFGGGTAVALGAAVSVLSLGLRFLGVRFDGFLDVHVTRASQLTLVTSIVDQLVAVILPAILFFAYARIVSRHVRFIDFLGMTGLARFPLLLLAAPMALLSSALPGASSAMTPAVVAEIAVGLVCIGWNITLLYRGFKNASGLEGSRLVAGFIAIAFVSEIVSKVVLPLLP